MCMCVCLCRFGYVLLFFYFFSFFYRESLKFKQFLNEFLFSAGADAGGGGCGRGDAEQVIDDCCSNKFIKSKFNGCTM